MIIIIQRLAYDLNVISSFTDAETELMTQRWCPVQPGLTSAVSLAGNSPINNIAIRAL